MAELALFPVPVPLSEQELSDLNAKYVSTKISLGVDSTENIVTTGNNSISGCMQRALKVLLTEKGSVPSNSTYGTNLVALSRYGYNSQNINEDVIVIILDAQSQCRKQDIAAGIPLEGQLASIELLDLVLLNTSQLKLTIGIKTAAGITGSFNIQV